MKKKILCVWLCISLIAVMAAGCSTTDSEPASDSGSGETEDSDEEELVTVRLALSTSAHVFNAIAEEQGYLEEAGIEVEYVPLDSSDDAFTALQAGQVDILSNYGTNMPLQYVAYGEDITMFAGYMLTGAMPIIASTGTEWNSVEDLIGKRVAGQANVYAVTGPLVDAGYDPLNDIDWLELSDMSERLEAVKSGEADYAIMGTGMAYSIQQSDDVEVMTYCSDITPDYSCCRVEAKTSWLEENEETVEKLLGAWLRAQQYYETHHEESVTILAEAIDTEEEVVAAYMDNEHYRLNLDPYKKSIEQAWDYMDKLGLLDTTLDIDVDDHINTELYKNALDACVEDYYDDDPEFYDKMMEIYEEQDT